MAKQKLVENILVSSRLFEKVDTPLQEAVVGGKSYEILAVYRFPFTRPGQENLNGRIYPYALWDRVFGMNTATVSLVNHPDDDGDPARIWAVMKNAGYNKDRSLGMVDCYIINNEYGKTAAGVLAAGGDIGLSSCGTGDFEIDGKTVAAESFELERWADWVLNPSYSVFGKIDDVKLEAVMTDLEKGNEKVVPASALGVLRENNAESGAKTLSLREKRDLEASLKKIYEDVKGIGPIRERLDRAKEALTFYEGTGVESYKKEFEDLVKEAENEFEVALAKGGQADTARKEAEETSQAVEEAKKEAEDLRKENETLRLEKEDLAGQLKESRKMNDYADGVLASLSESTRRKVPYENYAELRQYAVKAAKLYSEMKSDRNLLQIQVREMANKMQAAEDEWIAEYKKDASARARVEEARRRSAEAKALSEQRIFEAKEAELVRNANPEVLEYYNDLVRIDSNAAGLREQILSRRTLLEAQMLVLKSRRKNTGQMAESSPDARDLSVPLPVNNCRQVMPDVPIVLPKGFI
jgi:hypothetical protein